MLIFSETPASNSYNCKKVIDCIELYSKLTGEKVIYEKDLKGVFNYSENLEINKENIELVLSKLLEMSGLARVKIDKNLSRIINARDIRYTPVPQLNGDKDIIPNTSDYYLVSFTMKHVEDASDIVRNFRPFMTRYGRILDIRRSNTILITDTGANINRLKDLIKILDVPISSEKLKAEQERRKLRDQIRLEEAKSCHEAKEKFLNNVAREQSRKRTSSSNN